MDLFPSVPQSVEDTLWQRAVSDVVGCELAFRLRLLWSGAKPHEVPGVLATRDLVHGALRTAKQAYADFNGDACRRGPACRCRHEALAVVIAGKIARRTGDVDLDQLELDAIERINRYLDDRS